MVIRNRLFPYPVLAEDTDDYRGGDFIVKAGVTENTITDLTIHFSIELTNDDLKRCINNGTAEYAIHVECTQTSYREVKFMSSDETDFTVSKSAISGTLQLLGMIVAKKDIPYYKGLTLDSDYDDVEVFFPKGSIMAYYNIPSLNIYNNYEDLSTSENMFVLCKKERMSGTEHNAVSYNIRNDKILINVDDDVYNAYVRLKDRDGMNPLITTSLVLPALIYTLEELSLGGFDMIEECQGYLWYKQLNDYLKKGKKSIPDIVLDSKDPFVVIAQELLEKPISSLYNNILVVLEGAE